MKASYNRFLGAAPIIIVLAVAYHQLPGSLKFNKEGLQTLPAIIGSLIMLSIFVERSIEVFLSAWRGGGADELDRKIEIAEERVNDFIDSQENRGIAITTDVYKALSGELESAKTTRAQYRADSRFISQWLGMGIGVVLGLIGVRVLDSLLISGSIDDRFQNNLFIVVDVLITGVVIAGGSESINKIMKLYNTFMDSTAHRTKA